jgi:amino acid adenylation domain-containing protein
MSAEVFVFPCSFAQRRLWFLEQMEPGSPVYNIAGALRLEGPLDAAALQRALDTVVTRHEALRTSFAEVDGNPVQLVAEGVAAAVCVTDLSGLREEERGVEAERLMREESARPFDLGRAPLLRLSLLRLAASEHLLLVTLHHIISDGWSVSLLLRELAESYDAALRGTRPQLSALPVQYADYAVWEQEHLTDEALAPHLSYWRSQLEEAPAVLELPIDGARSSRQTWAGASKPLTLGGALGEGLKVLSRREGVTPFMIVLAGFAALLARYTGQTDIVIGTPIANRQTAQTEPLIGLFANTLVLLVRVGLRESFRQLLGQVRQTTLGAYEHQDVPFERLVEELHVERSLSHTPLFQVMMTFQDDPLRGFSWPGLRLSRVGHKSHAAQFDLTLSLTDEGGEFGGWIEYRADLFEGERIARMGEHLRRLLEAAVADPSLKLSEMPLLSEEERKRLVTGWNQTQADYGAGVCAHELFARQMTRTPEAVAAEDEHGQVTYAELDRRSESLARYLCRLGVGVEAVVALYLPRSLRLIEAVLGVLKAGGAYLPLDTGSPTERVRMMVEDAGVRVVLSESGDEEAVAGLRELGVRVIGVGREWESIESEVDSKDEEAVRSAVSAENLAYVIYTSGSTGRPKGVMVRHGSLVNFLFSMREQLGLGMRDVLLSLTTISFDIAALELFLPLIVGGRVVIGERETAFDGARILAKLDESGSTVLQATPATWRMLVEAGLSRRSHLKILCGGEAIDPGLWDELLGRGECFWNLYGPTETTIWSTACEVRTREASVSIGRPIANTQVYVLDPHAQLVPAGVQGELHIGGDGLARGYLRRPELTAERFVPDPFGAHAGGRLYRTGDLARWRSDGSVEFLGRRDHQVKIRGFRIELEEISAVLGQHEGVRECVVLAREDAPGEKRLVAYVVVTQAAQPTANDLRRHLVEKLPEYMVPVSYVMLNEMPLTSSGKIDRARLPRPDETDADEGDAVVRALSAVEEVVARVWEEVLGVERVKAGDDFFALGGHSLLAARVVGRVRERLGVEVGVRRLFESPTLAAFAESISVALRAGQELPSAPIRPVDRSGNLALSFAQQRLWFLDRFDGDSSTYNIPAPVRLGGTLNVAALEQATREIVRRHEILRTSFSSDDGQPFQSVARDVITVLPLIDLAGLDEEEREAASRRLMVSEFRRRFDLATAPLIRTTLLRLREDEHLLLVTMHHIASDGWSIGVFMRELAALYGAYCSGSVSPLEELSVQYADYTSWQREWLQGETLQTQLSYWGRQLEAVPLTAELPADHPRPPVRTYRGESESLPLPTTLVKALRELSRSEGVTLFMTLLAAFKALLHRYTSETDILVGSPIANRGRGETEELIGFFVNTLVMRTEVTGHLRFRELLARVREVTLGAYAHQDLPFERLLEEVQPDRDLSRTPLFQVFFNMLNLPDTRFESAGVEMSLLPPPEASAKFDVTMYVSEEKERLRLDIVYNADLFDRSRMTEMLRQFNHLLLQSVENPDVRVADYSLVTPEARNVLPDPTRTLGSTWEGAVHTLFSAHARKSPARLAVVGEDEVWTYQELDARSNQLANYLRASGIRNQDVVAIYAHRSAPLVLAFLGVMKAGAAFVILDPAYPATRLIDCMSMARPKAWLQLSAAGPLPAALEAFVNEQPLLCRLELFPRDATRAHDPLNNVTDENPQVEVGPDDVAYIAFTSGSTGRPKGILGRHGPLTHFLPWQCEAFALDASDRYSMLSGLSHDPLHRDIFTPLALGAAVCIPDPEQIATPGWLADWMKRREITVANLTPAMAQLLGQSVSRDGATDCKINSLRRAFVVGDILTRRDVARLHELAPSVTCINFYGSTETQRSVGYFVVPREAELVANRTRAQRQHKPSIPLGRGVRDVQLLILNHAQKLAGIGELGEIHLRSPHLAKGYLGDEALTRERFITNPFTGREGDRVYKTGDLGRYMPDANVEFAGRNDFQVKVRGFRIELAEVEAALEQHASVRRAVVVARDDGMGDKMLCAYLVASETHAPTRDELRRFLQDRLPAYMLPSVFVTLDALPLTPNGKIDRRALPAANRVEQESESGVAAHTTPIEEVLASIWSNVLGVGQVCADDNFFNLGGHSLLATQVIARIRAAFDVDIPVRVLFESPTPSSLAEYVETALKNKGGLVADAPLRPTPRDGELPLSLAQQRLWFLQQLEPDSSAYNIAAGVRLSGPLNLAALEQSLCEVVRRHEALRASFVAVDGMPVQTISRAETLTLPLIDLDGLPSEEQEARVRRLAEAESDRPFDLARGPLLRGCVLRLGARRHAVLFTVHHIVSDGWSMGVLVREVGELYRAFSNGLRSTLAPLPVQYVDYARWQRQALQGDALAAQVAYWKRQLAAPLPVLELPADRMRPHAPTFRSATHTVVLPAALRDSLKELSRREGRTLFMTLLAAFQTLLRFYRGQEEIVVGTDVANRNRVEAEGLIGFFVNQLVLRTDLSGNPTFRELLARVYEVVLGAYTHQDLPFDRLVEILNPARELSRTPLFQVKFVLQNTPAATLELDGLTPAPLSNADKRAKFDLLLNLWDTAEGLTATLEYNTDLFDASTISRLLRHYEILLQRVVAQPGATLDELAGALAEADHERQLSKVKELERANILKLKSLGRRTQPAVSSGGNLP